MRRVLRSRSALVAVVVITAMVVGLSGMALALSWSSNWVNTSLSKEKCMAQGRQVLINAKFSSISSSGASVYGTRGSYSAFVRAIPEKQIAFICVMGPDSQECDMLATFMKNNGVW
ncbi:MAG: hypothetical protein ABFD97_12930 [Syntrophobacter sp.]